ncbi:glycosyltransferase family 9 protein [Azospira inquinata]|uniref:Glycosyltransferase family 9 protein n=1 Tax=Azospira inquinata TaxID=2785627 RepID=A0A975XTN8_9RHOO|nr:glycosyltransferase family 9 protein [Azospira inquinata]QWT46747.1 glycosyltransferase family 9 protein [Azospira inquinata]QWT47929.1 glycosyltransferase family 9 protein [Azospira inquinata]
MDTAIPRLYPDGATIDFFCGNAGAAEFLSLLRPQSTVITFDHKRKSPGYIFKFFLNLRRYKYKSAYLGVGISPLYPLLLSLLAGIPDVHWEGINPILAMLGVKCHVPRPGHRVQRNLGLVGIQENISPESWPIPRIPRGYLPSFPDSDGLTAWLGNSPLLIIHPGSSAQQSATKRPDPLVLKSVEEGVSHWSGAWKIIRVFGPDEVNLIPLFPETPSARNLKIEGVGEILAVLARGNALIAGDSGYGHLATAVDLPVITLAGPTDVNSTKPWTSRGFVLRSRDHLDCMPCYETPNFYSCPYENRCMRSISASDIILTLKQLTHDAN